MLIIPYEDIRSACPIKLVEKYPEKARDIVNASRSSFGYTAYIASHFAMPLGDSICRAWLEKSNNPYRVEIERYAELLKISGIFALNLSYEWGCTSGAYKQASGVALARVLDWPFPGLGENLVVANQSGPAGDFYNVTWPAVSGVFNAMAPKRFSASLNQAPMRRHKSGIFLDWMKNRLNFHKQTALPPAHLLRTVFETATDYHQAREMLSTTPVSLPVIYTLAGGDEGCVIERLETDFAIRDTTNGPACTSNHFESHFGGIGHGWLPRALKSGERIQSAHALHPSEVTPNLAWFKPPIANHLSRLAMYANSETGELAVMGTKGEAPVTQIWRN